MNTLRFIHAADLHLDSAFESLPPELSRLSRARQRELLPRIAHAAVSHGAQALILSGDIFESDAVSPETQSELCRSLGALNIPVLLCTGNHDPYFPGSIWDRMPLPDNAHLFCSEKLSCLELPGLHARFWGAGFEREFCPSVLRDFTAPEKKAGVYDVMVLHADLYSQQSDWSPITPAQLEDSGMDYVALGHIHKRSPLLKAGGTAYAYPGCAAGRGFDETGEKGCYLITLSDAGAQAQFLPLGGAVYDIVRLDVEDGPLLDKSRSAISEYSENDHLRLVLTGECDERPDLQSLRSKLEGRLSGLQIYDETTIRRNVWAGLDRSGLEGLFLQKLKTTLDAAKTDTERQIIELAARYGCNALEGEGGRLL